MEDFEVCTFCGEVFKGDKMKDYKTHYVACREAYKEPEYDDRIEDAYWYGG